MARVLFCWEVGAAFGHLHTLVPIARALAATGHEIVVAVRDVVEPWNLLRDLPARFVAAPRPGADPRFADAALKNGSFTGVLASLGYARPDLLEPIVRAWDGVLDLAAPQLVVCDNAPTACLAAHGRVPVAMVGNGFSAPLASGLDFPPFDAESKSCIDPAAVLAAMSVVQKRRGRPPLKTVTEPFASATTFVTTYPELDPYGRTRASGVVGPLTVPNRQPGPPRREAYFAYLTAAQEGVLEVLRRLNRVGVRGAAYIRHLPPGASEQYEGSPLRVLDAPADVHKVLPEVWSVLHHGWAGLAEAALAHGRAQVILPLQAEQVVIARRLRDLGVCLPVLEKFRPTDVSQLVIRALQDPMLARRSLEVAARLHSQGPWDGLARIVDHCRSVLG